MKLGPEKSVYQTEHFVLGLRREPTGQLKIRP
jgi:hypothetical protein